MNVTASVFFVCLGSLVGGAPAEITCINSQQWLAVLSTLHVLLHQFGGHTDNVLSLPIFDHVQCLQCPYDVFLSEACSRAALCKKPSNSPMGKLQLEHTTV